MKYNRHSKTYSSTLNDFVEADLNKASATIGKELDLQAGLVRSVIRKYHQVAIEQGEFLPNDARGTNDAIINAIAKSTRINADDVARILDESTRMGNSGAISRSVSHPLTGSGILGEISGTLNSATRTVNTAKNTYQSARSTADSATKSVEQFGKATGADKLAQRNKSNNTQPSNNVPTRKVNDDIPAQQQAHGASPLMFVSGGVVVGGGAGYAIAHTMKWSVTRRIGSTIVGGVVGGAIGHFVGRA